MTAVVLASKGGPDFLAFSQRSSKEGLYSVSGGKSSEDFWARWQPPDEHSRRSYTPEVRLVEYQTQRRHGRLQHRKPQPLTLIFSSVAPSSSPNQAAARVQAKALPAHVPHPSLRTHLATVQLDQDRFIAITRNLGPLGAHRRIIPRGPGQQLPTQTTIARNESCTSSKLPSQDTNLAPSRKNAPQPPPAATASGDKTRVLLLPKKCKGDTERLASFTDLASIGTSDASFPTQLVVSSARAHVSGDLTSPPCDACVARSAHWRAKKGQRHSASAAVE